MTQTVEDYLKKGGKITPLKMGESGKRQSRLKYVTREQIVDLAVWCQARRGRTKELNELLEISPSTISRYVQFEKKCTEKKFSEIQIAMKKIEQREAGQSEMTAIDQVMDLHREFLEGNPYCYFELAYTRTTDWMVWICTNAREIDPDRQVLLKGQGDTPEQACQNALNHYQEKRITHNV